MYVTKLTPVTKAKYKVYLDEEFAFVLYKGELSLYGIQEGKELSQDVVERIKKEVLVKRAKLRALHILERADRTEAELAAKLKQDIMPLLFTFFGLRFMFYSNDHEPIHVHVVKGKGKVKENAKFNILPEIVLVENNGLQSNELKMAEMVIEENKELITEKWNEFFNKNKKTEVL